LAEADAGAGGVEGVDLEREGGLVLDPHRGDVVDAVAGGGADQGRDPDQVMARVTARMARTSGSAVVIG
jgi:hypothetical protein